MTTLELTAENRTITGRAVRALRRQNILPAVIYGHGFKAMPIQVDVIQFKKVYSKAGESTMVYVMLNGQKHPAIIQDLVMDPISDEFIHADFHKVRLDEKITATVPLVFTGVSVAIKDLKGILVKNIDKVEVIGLPQDLPHEITVDIGVLVNFQSHVLLKDLIKSDKITIKGNIDEIVALVQQPISEDELKKQLEVSTGSAEEVELIKKEKPIEEGEEDVATETPTGAETKVKVETKAK